MNDKFDYLESLIGDLSQNEKYVVLVFLLKAQRVEYGLKYLLGWYPFKPENYYEDDFLDRATIGSVINKIEGLNDSHLSEIINEAKAFNKIRKEVVHHLLTSERSIKEIENECAEKISYATSIEMRIHYLMDYVHDLVYGPFH